MHLVVTLVCLLANLSVVAPIEMLTQARLRLGVWLFSRQRQGPGISVLVSACIERCEIAPSVEHKYHQDTAAPEQK